MVRFAIRREALTHRAMYRPRLYTRAKQTLNPMDLLPPGSFAQELAIAALAQFLKPAK